MKFIDLKLLFDHHLKTSKMPDNGTARYIKAAYKRVSNEMAIYDDTATVSIKKINALNITDHMKEKLIRLSRQSLPSALRKQRATTLLKARLSNVLGVGDKKIDALLAQGLTNMNQLRQKKWLAMLPESARLMLQYKPIRKIPHDDIKKMQKTLTSFKGAHVELVGSFRRRKSYSKDIDILIRTNDVAMLDRYVKYLEKQFSEVHIYSRGSDRISLIVVVAGAKSYKLDIFRASCEEYHTNLLYSTGSKEFNIMMRGKARKMGYLLNQSGLFKGHKKINKASDDDRALFKYLDMPFVAPHDR